MRCGDILPLEALIHLQRDMSFGRDMRCGDILPMEAFFHKQRDMSFGCDMRCAREYAVLCRHFLQTVSSR